MMRFICVLSILAFVSGTVTYAASKVSKEEDGMDSFQAGVAVRDITPLPGASLWGYSDREGAATGTLDPLYAKAIAFRAGATTVALVTLDLGRAPMQPVRERIRRRAKNAGVDYVSMMASHTHHAPAMEDVDAPYMAPIEDAIAACIEEAAADLRPAAIGVTRTEIDVAHNRRILTGDGRCLMLWRNDERAPTAPVDKEAGVILVSGTDGRPLAVLVNYACHPVVMGPSNLQYSADYPGEMARLVEEATGAPCLFLQGACGNINPYLDKTPMAEGGADAMRSVGRTCADTVIAALAAVKPASPETPSAAFVEKQIVVGTRWDIENPSVVEILRGMYGPVYDVYMQNAGPAMAVPLSVIVLNGNLALAGMPGEIFIQYQIELKAGSPLRDTFLCGYANDFFAYFPTVRDAAAGGYGGSVPTYVGLGAGDKLTAEAEIEIGRLIGKLNPVCTPEDFVVLDAEL